MPNGRCLPFLFPALALLLSLAAGCAAPRRTAPPALPTGPADRQVESAQAGWWRAEFRFAWPEGDDPRWYLDLLAADRIVEPTLVVHGPKIALWRFHRRAVKDSAGHQFSFIFYTDRSTARSILSDIENHPLVSAARRAGLLDTLLCSDPDGEAESGIGATSDAKWSEPLRQSWPYFIMGVSAMWLDLIHRTADENPPPDAAVDALGDYYRALDNRMADIWQEEAQHALLHHLNAVFGYRPLMMKKMMRF